MAEQKKWEEAKKHKELEKILDITLADMIRTDIMYYISRFFKEEIELNKMIVSSLERTIEDLRIYIDVRKKE